MAIQHAFDPQHVDTPHMERRAPCTHALLPPTRPHMASTMRGRWPACPTMLATAWGHSCSHTTSSRSTWVAQRGALIVYVCGCVHQCLCEWPRVAATPKHLC